MWLKTFQCFSDLNLNNFVVIKIPRKRILMNYYLEIYESFEILVFKPESETIGTEERLFYL